MRPIFILLLLIICHWAIGQSTGGRPESTSTTIPSAIQKPSLIAGKQSQLVMANPSNATAWLDYYKWLANTKELAVTEKQQALAQTLQSSRQYISGSWQFSLMNFIQSGKRNKSFLDAAINQSDNKAMVYPYAIQFAIITQNQALLNEYTKALNELSPLSPALYEYHYNALMSAGNNGIIYAKGISDLAPMAVLQQVYGIRKDVRFRYYEQTITDTANAFICLSAGKDILQQYPAAGYSGLLVKVSGNAELQQAAASFKLVQLRAAERLGEDEKLIYKNYLPSFILLYRQCKANNKPTEAADWMMLAQRTGRLTGSIDTVNKMLSE